MHFKFSKKKIIKVIINNRLYIITHVAKEFKEIAFMLTNISIQDTIENTSMLIKLKEEWLELTKD